MDKFNYVIGFDWGSNGGTKGIIGAYMIHNREIFFGTVEDADETLTYVKSKGSKTNYKIYKLEEYVTGP